MKKLLPFSLIILVLLSGMNFSFAAHYCEGRLAALRFSFNATAASCGMEAADRSVPSKSAHFRTQCCVNEMTFFRVDDDYFTSDCLHKITPAFASKTPWQSSPSSEEPPKLASTQYATLDPLFPLFSSAVYLARICQMRI